MIELTIRFMLFLSLLIFLLLLRFRQGKTKKVPIASDLIEMKKKLILDSIINIPIFYILLMLTFVFAWLLIVYYPPLPPGEPVRQPVQWSLILIVLAAIFLFVFIYTFFQYLIRTKKINQGIYGDLSIPTEMYVGVVAALLHPGAIW